MMLPAFDEIEKGLLFVLGLLIGQMFLRMWTKQKEPDLHFGWRHVAAFWIWFDAFWLLYFLYQFLTPPVKPF